MLGNLKSTLGDYLEIIILLAIIPLTIGLWAAFAAAAGGQTTYELIAVLTTNDTTLTFNESNITLIITDAPIGNESIRARVLVNGTYDIYINGTMINATGTYYRATVIFEQGNYSTTFGSFSVAYYYDIELGYISGQASFAIRVMKDNNYDWGMVKFPDMQEMYVYRVVTNNSNTTSYIIDGFFTIFVLAAAGSVLAKVMRG